MSHFSFKSFLVLTVLGTTSFSQLLTTAHATQDLNISVYAPKKAVLVSDKKEILYTKIEENLTGFKEWINARYEGYALKKGMHLCNLDSVIRTENFLSRYVNFSQSSDPLKKDDDKRRDTVNGIYKVFLKNSEEKISSYKDRKIASTSENKEEDYTKELNNFLGDFIVNAGSNEQFFTLKSVVSQLELLAPTFEEENKNKSLDKVIETQAAFLKFISTIIETLYWYDAALEEKIYDFAKESQTLSAQYILDKTTSTLSYESTKKSLEVKRLKLTEELNKKEDLIRNSNAATLEKIIKENKTEFETKLKGIDLDLSKAQDQLELTQKESYKKYEETLKTHYEKLDTLYANLRTVLREYGTSTGQIIYGKRSNLEPWIAIDSFVEAHSDKGKKRYHAYLNDSLKTDLTPSLRQFLNVFQTEVALDIANDSNVQEFVLSPKDSVEGLGNMNASLTEQGSSSNHRDVDASTGHTPLFYPDAATLTKEVSHELTIAAKGGRAKSSSSASLPSAQTATTIPIPVLPSSCVVSVASGGATPSSSAVLLTPVSNVAVSTKTVTQPAKETTPKSSGSAKKKSKR
ncbi:MAG TPA: hypothetical protein VI959_02445 [Alphaproteobacteria bacterium]|nr:hypothetical protein [Alphaproteobacteria bacterium]